MLVQNVLTTINKYSLIEKGEGIVVGVSGGPDSICLLHVLHELSNDLFIRLYAVHINHMLRGQESKGDEAYTADFCRSLNIPLYIRPYDIKMIADQRGISLEEAGREIRYHEFGLIADKTGATKIAVAHNRNDQAETVLMRIIRGTGLEGLKGIGHRRGRIIRPLLDVERKDIEKYCADNSLNPRTDSSNLEAVYTRNKIRLDLIPYINRIFDTDIVDSLVRMSALVKEDNEFIEAAVDSLYDKCVSFSDGSSISLNIDRLREHGGAIKGRILRKAIQQIKNDLKGIEHIHIDDILNLALNGRTGAEIHLPQGIRASKSYNTLKIFIYNRVDYSEILDKIVDIPGRTEVEALKTWIEASVFEVLEGRKRFSDLPAGSLLQYFDYEKLKMGISIRSRNTGDMFKPLGSNGTKKLKEYYIDNKIPRELRDNIPLIAKNNEIVWIIGYKISDKFKVTENTKSVLRLEYKKLAATNKYLIDY